MKTKRLGRKIKPHWRTAARTSTGASTINLLGKSGENKTRTNIRTENDKNIWANMKKKRQIQLYGTEIGNKHVINIVSLFLLSSFSFALFIFLGGCTTGGKIVNDRQPWLGLEYRAILL